VATSMMSKKVASQWPRCSLIELEWSVAPLVVRHVALTTLNHLPFGLLSFFQRHGIALTASEYGSIARKRKILTRSYFPRSPEIIVLQSIQ
jgi:hypothetical protein